MSTDNFDCSHIWTLRRTNGSREVDDGVLFRVANTDLLELFKVIAAGL